MLASFPSFLGAAGEKHVLLCHLSGFTKHVMHLLLHLKVSTLLEFSGEFGLMFMLGPGLPIVLQRSGAFLFLIFIFFSKFCFSVNHYFHGGQVVATVHLFRAGSELKLLANSVFTALSISAMAQTDRGNEFKVFCIIQSHTA